MTDDELKDLLARMFKCNMDRKVIKRKIEEYLDTFTDGKELFKSIGCRINEHNTPETDLHKYILDTMINI
jgi:glucuronate isomerase